MRENRIQERCNGFKDVVCNGKYLVVTDCGGCEFWLLSSTLITKIKENSKDYEKAMINSGDYLIIEGDLIEGGKKTFAVYGNKNYLVSIEKIFNMCCTDGALKHRQMFTNQNTELTVVGYDMSNVDDPDKKVHLYRNGNLQHVSNYSISGNTVTPSTILITDTFEIFVFG